MSKFQQNQTLSHNLTNSRPRFLRAIPSVLVMTTMSGVIDHNTFDTSRSPASAAFRIIGTNNVAWAEPTGLGASNFIFFEDNTYAGLSSAVSSAEDCYTGGRFVLRFNSFDRTDTQMHPTGGSGQARGCRAWEIYLNRVNTAPAVANPNFLCM